MQVTSSVPEVTVSIIQNYGNIDARTRKDNMSTPFTISIDPLFSESTFNLTMSTFQEGISIISFSIPS